jgi:hypothetical protein
MFSSIKKFKLFLEWKDTPYSEFTEIHELCMMAARRCAHDLNHASSAISDSEKSTFIYERSNMWRDIFYPVENQKRYRHELHMTIRNLEYAQEQLCKILEKNNVPLVEYEKYSPDGGIPF